MRFTKSDAAVTLLTLLLAGTLLWFFFQEFNRTVSRGTMEPAGTIVFKRRAADRRAVVGLIWERMRNNSPVYDGDILRTGGGAEAAILFDGGGGIDLFENTMLELNLTAEGRNIAVETGSFVLSGSDDPSARPLVVSLGNHGITLPHGASAAVTLGAGRLEIDVTRGSLSVSGPSGETVPVEQGQGVVIDLADGERTLVTYDIVPENPAHNAKLLLFGTGPEPVLFGCSGDSRGAVLEIAAESGFGQPLSEAPVSDSGEAAAALPPGVYFWRFRNDDSLSPPRRIVVLGDSYPAQIGPAPDAAFSFRRTPPQVQFSWTSSEYAVSYRLEIAADDGFSEPVRQVRTLLSSARATMPGEGTWFWRVVPEYPFETAGGTPAPEIRELRVARSETMESPAAVSPLEGTLVSIDTVEGKGLSFSWNPVPEAVGYELRVYPPGSGEAVRYVAGVPFLRIGSDDAAPYQAPGNYSWEVSWRDGEGILSPPGERRTLHVIDSEPSFYLTFPPDGYTIADSLAPDTRFAW